MAHVLAPGTPVLRRHDGRVQVGLDPRTAVVLPAGSDAMLAELRTTGATTLPPAALPLLEAGLLVERSALPVGVDDDQAPVAAAVLRAHGDAAASAWDARCVASIGLVGYGGRADPLVARARRLLDDAGVAHEPATSGSAGPCLLVGTGEPDRELVDDWMRRGVPHVLVRLTEGRAVAGPFVDPGRSACLRCLDAHHTDADPTWPLLVRQHAALARRHRPDDPAAPEPVDPVLASLALAWAVRDLLSWVEGAAPSLLSGTLTLDALLADVEVRTWARHPGCGCSWQAATA